MRRAIWLILLLLPLLGAGLRYACTPAVGGRTPRLFVASGQVTDLAIAADGTVWAVTRGGLLRWAPGKADPRRWTTADGLAGNDLRAVILTADGARAADARGFYAVKDDGAITPCQLDGAGEIRSLASDDAGCWIGSSEGVYLLDNNGLARTLRGNVRRVLIAGKERWAVTDRELVYLNDDRRWPLPDSKGNLTALAVLGDRRYVATALGLWELQGNRWTEIALPRESSASHVSALAVQNGTLLAGLYGDGLYARAAGRWTRLPGAPACFSRLTALAAGTGGLAAGTQGDGVWVQQGTGWKPLRTPDAIPSADIYGITAFSGSLWASTFDGGLLCISGDRVAVRTRKDGLSSDCPRDLLVFAGKLYVRHTTGELDCSDGRKWKRAFAREELPRQEVYAMATDGTRLYLGTWAGWAATDGTTWEHHFREPALQGHVITAIAAQGGTVWLGTQKGGLFAWRDGALTQYHESHGLTDDWITRLAVRGDRLLAGTYTGGLLEWQEGKFVQRLTADGFTIRDIAFDDSGTALAATPLGVYREGKGGWTLLPPAQYAGLEAQALYPAPDGLWIGTRAALAYVPE